MNNKPFFLLDCYYGRIEMVKKLLDTKEINQIDYRGFTPLHAAAEKGDPEGAIIKLLLDKGIDKQKKTFQGETPYQIAKFYQRPRHVLDLLA